MEMITTVHGKDVDDMSETELRDAVKLLVSLHKAYEDARAFSRELDMLRPRRTENVSRETV